ncbi:hypothetical protein ILYODFUR_014485 [Ilyodon furcidens]|uniref:Uncharacterized protein n=1 Tax=Ilyodon furcidens TaxID=33524 RepID=A0ABV0VDX7_9TELE
MALVTVQRSPTPSTSSSPCVSESGSGEDDRRSQPRRGQQRRCKADVGMWVREAALLIQGQIGNHSQTQSACVICLAIGAFCHPSERNDCICAAGREIFACLQGLIICVFTQVKVHNRMSY